METTPATVLITGGTGFIGTHLTKLLRAEGFNVTHLSRTVSGNESVKTYKWRPTQGYIEDGAIEQADYIIHLAGAGIADKRWTEERKKVILDSRVKSAGILFKKASVIQHKVKAFISASAVGYYGTITSEKIFTETDSPGNDFTAYVCKSWEEAADRFLMLNMRTVKIRTAIVLGPDGGALQKIALPVKYYAGAPLGTGNQYFPWIHIDDVCRVYLKAIKDDTMLGSYNAVAPHHITNRDLIKTIAKVLDKPLILPNVPSFAIKLALGEMGNAVLNGSRVSCEKLRQSGFTFQYPELIQALEDCLKIKKL